MKTKLFFAAMAAVAVIGCQKEPNAPVHEADGTASFMKVDLKAAGTMTKADTGTFEYGTEAENAVKSVTFYFFKNGEKYVVQGTDNYMTGNVTDWTQQGTAGDKFSGDNKNLTIEDISGLILVIKQHANPDDLPNQMVAILNAPADLKTSMTLSELEGKVVKSLKEGENFIMSNSVYVDNNDVHINYTSISKDNLFIANLEDGQPGYNIPGTIINPDDAGYGDASAQGKPVEIYVERVAAKVRVNGITEKANESVVAKRLVVKESSESNNQLTITRITGYNNGAAVTEDVPVYAKVLGWDVTNTKNDASVLKALEDAWKKDTGFGFTPWTSPDFHRSYWAKSTESDPVHKFTFNNLISTKNLVNGYQYYFENTADYKSDGNGVDHPINNTTANQASQLLVAVQLLAVNGDTETQLNVARWYDKYYTIEALQNAMVNTINTKVFKKDGGQTITPIVADDVVFAQVDDTKNSDRYHVVLSAKEEFDYVDVAGNPMSADAVNAILATVDPAQMWYNGYAYYYTTIDHFGTAKGIIRNHLYDITIQNISGLGTPVYDPDGVITPEKPEDLKAHNLSARINILSWHLVSQEVTLN